MITNEHFCYYCYYDCSIFNTTVITTAITIIIIIMIIIIIVITTTPAHVNASRQLRGFSM